MKPISASYCSYDLFVLAHNTLALVKNSVCEMEHSATFGGGYNQHMDPSASVYSITLQDPCMCQKYKSV